MTGEAFSLRIKLAKLMQRHGVVPKSVTIPLVESHAGALTVSGLAATADVDLGRQKFRPYAFTNLCLTLKGYPFPPLCLKHDESKVVGQITNLKYDDRGQLRIVADVTDERAKRFGAFSVGVKVSSFEIVNPDSADFHGVITKAEITEISLTDVPANPQALVQYRYPTPPFEAYAKARHAQSELFSRAVTLLLKQVEAIAVLAATPPPPRPPRVQKPMLSSTPQAVQPRPTQFSELVQQLATRT